MNSAKTLAQQTAKQIVREPWEILGGAGKQVTGVEQSIQPNSSLGQHPSAENLSVSDEARFQEQDKAQSVRRIEALDRELQEIERQRVFNELQRKIQGGQEVYLNDITELSYEQKDVLRAQIETIKVQKSQIQNNGPVQEPASKPSRRFAFGKGAKAQALKEQTKTERPLPPSG